MFDTERAREILNVAGVFFGDYSSDGDSEEDKKHNKELMQTLNMNDTWAWACSDGEYVPDDKLSEVARLFWLYGNAGLLYWASNQNDGMRSEFLDNNRAIDFVTHEEDLVKKVPNSSERAYKKIVYKLGK